MRILLLLSHPAQFLFFRNPVNRLREAGHTIYILTKTKDVLSGLLNAEGWTYTNILPGVRGQSRFAILWSLIIRNYRILRWALKNRIDLMTGTDASLAQVSWLLNIPCITTLEDDYQVIKNLARLSFPVTRNILVPEVCDVGRWTIKKTGYQGYMKLSYLHPNVFQPCRQRVQIPSDKPYFLIRLSALGAHHDFGINGISHALLQRLISLLDKKGRVYISAEKELPEAYAPYLLRIPAQEMHHYLGFAHMLICDSQSMAVEAAMLGTASIRVSSFTGRISVLEELEHRYGLTFGILPEHEQQILDKTLELLAMANLREEFEQRRRNMLADKIDVASFVTWYIGHYPESQRIMQENPGYQERFR